MKKFAFLLILLAGCLNTSTKAIPLKDYAIPVCGHYIVEPWWQQRTSLRQLRIVNPWEKFNYYEEQEDNLNPWLYFEHPQLFPDDWEPKCSEFDECIIPLEEASFE